MFQKCRIEKLWLESSDWKKIIVNIILTNYYIYLYTETILDNQNEKIAIRNTKIVKRKNTIFFNTITI